MSSWGFAPRVTQLTFSAAGTQEVAVENGTAQPIRVWGYTIANTHASNTATVTLRSGDGNTDYAIQSVAAEESFVSDVAWLADKALEVVVSGTVTVEVSIFHSAPGS